MTGQADKDIPALFAAARSGHRASLAKLLSCIERGGSDARTIGALSYPLATDGYTVGITGAPGAGKSTLNSALVAVMRARGEHLAVLAIDPSSPFTGGAILGDRVRMQSHALDPHVFIRSMATRGHLGGLALAAPEAARLLMAVGRPWVLVETVGVGQVEVEIAGAADTTVVVVNPGWGDAVQANKAGLMEIADVFVINKSDRAGTADTRRDLEHMLDLANAPDAQWRPPIIETVANRTVTSSSSTESVDGSPAYGDGNGVAGLAQAIDLHRAHIEASGELLQRRQRRVIEELQGIVAASLRLKADSLIGSDKFAELQDQVLARTIDPWEAARQLLV